MERTSSGVFQTAAAIWRSPLLEVLFQPFEIFLDLRSVNHEQKFRLANSVNNQVVDDAAVRNEQKSVLPLADLQLRHIIRQHGIEPITRTFSRDDKLAH